jgi:hypothetical protein
MWVREGEVRDFLGQEWGLILMLEKTCQVISFCNL